MGLNWPGASMVGGDMEAEDQTAVQELLNDFADRVEAHLQIMGLPAHASPLWRPWNLVVAWDAEKVLAAFSVLTGGMADLKWLDRKTQLFPPAELVRAIRDELGQQVAAVVILPLPQASDRKVILEVAAQQHAREVERASRLGRLGDLTGVAHLEPHLRDFLNDHPDPDKNVFVMMRFLTSPQLDEVHASIRDTLATRGFHAVRADDRDYTGELWSNIEVYMTCCRLGIAVFEDIESRDFNPNVSLELGYMLGRRKRCLILKEQRLPDLPADVVHRLYKPFDMFNVGVSVSREVARWVDVDLGVGAVGAP
jgi:hypothetical protein